MTPDELAAAENAALTEAIDETEPDAAAGRADATETASDADRAADAEPEPEPEPRRSLSPNPNQRRQRPRRKWSLRPPWLQSLSPSPSPRPNRSPSLRPSPTKSPRPPDEEAAFEEAAAAAAVTPEFAAPAREAEEGCSGRGNAGAAGRHDPLRRRPVLEDLGRGHRRDVRAHLRLRHHRQPRRLPEPRATIAPIPVESARPVVGRAAHRPARSSPRSRPSAARRRGAGRARAAAASPAPRQARRPPARSLGQPEPLGPDSRGPDAPARSRP